MTVLDGRCRAAFFDLDGTLMDREPLMQVAVATACADAGLVLADDEVGMQLGRAWPDVHRLLDIRARLGLDLASFLDLVFTTAEALIAAGFDTPVLAGGRTLIERFHAAGTPVVLVTGSVRREADQAIEQLGIGALLAGSLAGDEYAPGKPSPVCYRDAAALVGLDAAVDGPRCIVFEDSVVGIAAGLAAGMRVIASAAANQPAGHPSHQDQSAAHLVVSGLTDVSDAVIAAVLRTP
jgi:beta-phosphoglucomutase-like phosphatase (HAD superfamily)